MLSCLIFFWNMIPYILILRNPAKFGVLFLQRLALYFHYGHPVHQIKSAPPSAKTPKRMATQITMTSTHAKSWWRPQTTFMRPCSKRARGQISLWLPWGKPGSFIWFIWSNRNILIRILEGDGRRRKIIV